jgi:hypothetical protein
MVDDEHPFRQRRGTRAEEVSESDHPLYLEGGSYLPTRFYSIGGLTEYSARSRADGVLTAVLGCSKTASK